MIKGFYQQTGISITYSDSLVSSIKSDTVSLTSDVQSYQHTIAALGGYDTATFSLALRQVDAENWFSNGLLRHIEVYNTAMVKIWEGYVDTVKITVGGLTITRGPISTVVNRCSIIYGQLDTTQNPPIQNRQVQSAISENTDSQARWGIWEQILGGGQSTQADAEEMRDAYLAEYSEPETSQSISIQPESARNTPVTIECKGYQYFLDAGIYNQTVNSGTTQLETKMADILDDAGADPNTLFSSTNADIFTAGILVQEYENENLKPKALINSMVALGDGTADYGRTVWGVYNNREFIYDQIPTTPLYQQHLSDPSQSVKLYGSGGKVRPWDVRPAQWIFFPDFLVGRTQPTAELRLDPRYAFIESVSYTAPFSVTMNCSKVSSIPQLLARTVLKGFGA